MKRRFKCVVQYDGTDFRGWQSQACGQGIQDFIERRLFELFKVQTRTHASGRTDAGVHAKAQIMHFDADWDHGAERLQMALRCGFPAGIQISKVSICNKKFHARYDAVRKKYAYYIYEGFAPPHLLRYRWSMGHRKLDVAKMNEAAAYLIGKHDFTPFSMRFPADKEDPVKDMTRLDVKRKGKEIVLTTEASGYMYKMVRAITGALVDVGLGKLEPVKIKEILDGGERVNLYQTAPAQGLFLEKVYY